MIVSKDMSACVGGAGFQGNPMKNIKKEKMPEKRSGEKLSDNSVGRNDRLCQR